MGRLTPAARSRCDPTRYMIRASRPWEWLINGDSDSRGIFGRCAATVLRVWTRHATPSGSAAFLVRYIKTKASGTTLT